MNKKHLKIKIHGKVQGVFFRDTTCKRAGELGLSGWVRNESDGTVYIEIEGDPLKVDEFIRWCSKGPKMAKIDKIQSKEGQIRGFSCFEVCY